MKISLNWLKDFIEITESPDELGKILTGTGLEVEDIQKIDSIPGGLEGFVVGQVLTCERFEVKDKKLSLTTVDIGAAEPSTIVCGAANVAAGQKVIVATVGTTLYKPDGSPIFTIDKRKVYGHPSEGMICAEDEIGIGTSHDGILVLDTQLPNGTPAAQFFSLESDYCIEIGLTPNRADAASHLGVARDISAFTGRPIRMPAMDSFTALQQASPIEVLIENTDDCPRFCGLYLKNITVAPSPAWLQNRLKAIGLNPINNVVDITNYVNHELGQPLHAYDAKEITGQKVIVKNLAEGSKFITLDSTERSLAAHDLMVCNATEPMCIAGVFGGQKSGVKADTTEVFLEVAYFDPASIRKTSMHHGLKTDASFRNERGTDPDMKLITLKRAASLLVELTGATIASTVIDHYPKPIAPKQIHCSYSRIEKLIGVKIGKLRIQEILQSLDIDLAELNDNEFVATVPAFRVDVERDVDLVEEVLRIYGFDNVPLSDHLGSEFISGFPQNDKNKLQIALSNMLAGGGFSEIQTNSLTKAGYHAAIKADLPQQEVEILNKLSEDLGVMRQSLLFTGMEVLAYNINRRQKDLKLFEFGKTYHKVEEKYKENTRLALFMVGNQWQETWQFKAEKASFHSLANEVQKVFTQFRLNQVDVKPIEQSDSFAYGLVYMANKKEIGRIGLVKPAIAKLCDIKSSVFYADLDWDYLLKQYKSTASYKEISKFPEVRRDLSLVLDEGVSFSQVHQLAQNAERKLLKAVNAFDVYQGSNLGEGKKSYSLSFTLQDETQTLTDSQIDAVMNKLIRSFEQELGAVIRS